MSINEPHAQRRGWLKNGNPTGTRVPSPGAVSRLGKAPPAGHHPCAMEDAGCTAVRVLAHAPRPA
jgi:hypothetical protein